MKTEKNILLAFLLNLGFSVFELIGGIFTGSVAILSDALHDLGDALSIGISYFLEKKSRKGPDDSYTYGGVRYSALGSFVTSFILLTGSCYVMFHSVRRLCFPVPVHYEGMFVLALVGVLVNLVAAYFTRHGDSMNQKAVNLHLLEDVLGWAVVLVGSVLMHFTDLVVLDPLMSLCVSVFILVHALRHIKEIVNLFLLKVPDGLCMEEIRESLTSIEGVLDVHHLHIWSIDPRCHCASLHVVTEGEPHSIKERIREKLQEYHIVHTNIELERKEDVCSERECHIDFEPCSHHH